MKCRTFEKQLQDYLDSILEDVQTEEMKQHASSCSACSGLLRRWIRTSEAVRSLPQVESQPDLEIVLRRRLKNEKTPGHWFSWVFVPKLAYQMISVGLLGVAIGSAVFYLFQPTEPTETQVAAPIHKSEEAGISKPLPPSSIPKESRSAERGAYPVGIPVASGMPESAFDPTEVNWSSEAFLRDPNGEYVEYLLKGTGQEEILVRMPKVIRVRPPVENDQGYFRYISH
jgi:hypothetical protein